MHGHTNVKNKQSLTIFSKKSLLPNVLQRQELVLDTTRIINREKGTNIQDVPLATEPGISLIILTPLKILQRNLNSSTFVV